MKENIYTIPVMDGFKSECECPFCSMKHTLEKEQIQFILGPAYMEDDIRQETNKQGFCNTHLKQLSEEKNQLGMALMLHTHMVKTREQLEKLIEQHPHSNNKSSFKLLGKNKDVSPSNLQNFVNEKIDSCYVCSKVNHTFDRYMDTFFFLLKKDPQMWTLLENCNGFCYEHFNTLLHIAPKHLKKDKLLNFTNMLAQTQIRHLKRVEDDLEWFTKKFDHRFHDAPWKNSKDAVPRAMIKTNGLIKD